MTDLDRAATRRDVADALVTAFDRRHEVLDAIVEAEDRPAAIAAITSLLDKSELGAEAILQMSFGQLTKTERRKNQAELDDVSKELTFTLAERPASSGDSITLRTFLPDSDTDIFSVRTEELGVAGDGTGAPASAIGDEIASASTRMDLEEAIWLVAVEGEQKVGIVFGELHGHEVEVRVWIHPQHRKHGYGTAALRKSRAEMAVAFPGVPMVVRAPSS